MRKAVYSATVLAMAVATAAALVGCGMLIFGAHDTLTRMAGITPEESRMLTAIGINLGIVIVFSLWSAAIIPLGVVALVARPDRAIEVRIVQDAPQEPRL